MDGRVRAMLNSRFDHSFYGLEPNYSIATERVPTINDVAPSLIASGAVRIRPCIEKITSNGVTFIDGSTADNIDAIICATGLCALLMNSKKLNDKTRHVYEICKKSDEMRTRYSKPYKARFFEFDKTWAESFVQDANCQIGLRSSGFRDLPSAVAVEQ